MKKIFETFKSAIEHIENLPVPFYYFLLTFLAVINIRTFIESLIYHYTFSSYKISDLFHVNLFYISLSLTLILIFYFITNESIIRISRVIMTSFTIVLLPPIIDLLSGGVEKYNPTYLPGDGMHKLLENFFTFFGNMQTNDPGLLTGITPGMKIEIFVVIVMSFLYFRLKKLNIAESLLFSILIYSIIFFYFITPQIMNALSIPNNLPDQKRIVSYFLLTSFLFFIPLMYFSNKNYFKSIIRDARPLRLAHFLLMIFFGISVAQKLGHSSKFYNVLDMLMLVIAISGAWLYSVMTNNIEDQQIDQVSNQQRPLIKEKLDLETYRKISWLVLGIALIYSFASGIWAFFSVLVFIGSYFIYSMPPLRLKRLFFLSKLVIAFNSLLLVILGYTLNGGSTFNFPSVLYVLFLVGFTATLNFIDLKDYAGDKAAGIKTLPVVLGMKKSQLIIGVFFLIGYASAYLYFSNLYLKMLFVLFGIIQFYFINKNDYKEKPVLLFYLLSLIILIRFL